MDFLPRLLLLRRRSLLACFLGHGGVFGLLGGHLLVQISGLFNKNVLSKILTSQSSVKLTLKKQITTPTTSATPATENGGGSSVTTNNGCWKF